MKKYSYALWGLALASLLISSCAKEVNDITSEDVVSQKMVTFNFSAEKAGDETKTQAVVGASSVSYEWTADDVSNIKLYLVNGSSLSEVASPTITKNSATNLTISATVPESETYTFRAVLAREYYSKGKPMISKYQSPKTDNYDPKGDILFSDDLVVDGPSSTPLLLTFRRKVSVNCMTLRALGNTETVSQVTISSDKNLVGYYDGTELVNPDGWNTLVLTYENEDVNSDGTFPVYFTCTEDTGHTLTVTVKTDKKTYTKEFGGAINFALGKYFPFGVTMPSGVAPSETWDLVTDSSVALADGDIIFITNSAVSYAMGADAGDYREREEATSINSGAQVEFNSSFQQITLEATGDYFYLKVGSDAYLYASSSSKNYLATDTKENVGNNGKFSISVANTGVATITAHGNNSHNKLYYNGSASRFSCYENAQTAIKVFRKTTPDLTIWNLAELGVSGTFKKTGYVTGDTFDHTGMVITAHYEDASDNTKTKDVVLSNTDITISPCALSATDSKVVVSYCGETVDVTGITVNKKTPTLTIAPSSVNLASAGKTQQLVVSGTDGVISFVSNNTSVATVTSTGLITAIANGSTTISVSSAATEDYNAAGPTNVAVNVGATQVIFTAGTDTGTSSVTKNGVTISMSTMNESVYKCYKSSNMSITTVDTNKRIKEIIVTCSDTGTNKYGPGCFLASGYTYESEGYTGTWSGNSNSVSIAASTNQVRMSEIKVTYQ